MSKLETIIKALIEGEPIKKDWWFDGDYLKVKGRDLSRYSKGHKPDNCTNQTLDILANIVESTDDWIVGTKEVK